MDLESDKPWFESWLQALVSCKNLNKLFNFSKCRVLSYTCDRQNMKHKQMPNTRSVQFSSVQFSHSVVSSSLWPLGLQHARLPCLSPTPGAYSNSCPSSQWCHSTILILCGHLLLPPSIFPSIRVFSNESVLHIRCPKYWSFSFSISPSNEY